MGRVAAAAPAKGAPVPRDEVQEAVDKFVESAVKSDRIMSEVWLTSSCFSSTVITLVTFENAGV